MNTRQFSSKDNVGKQENKSLGAKTLPSSPNNFQLKAADTSESSEVDSSKGVAQLNKTKTALTVAEMLLESATPYLAGAGSAAGRAAATAAPYAKAAGGVAGGVAAFNGAAGFAKNAAFMGAGGLYNDPHLGAEGGVGFFQDAATNAAPSFLEGGIEKAGESSLKHIQDELTKRGIIKKIDPSQKPLPSTVTDMMDSGSKLLKGTPFAAADPTSGIKSANDSAGLLYGMFQHHMTKDTKASQDAEAAKMAKDSAAEHDAWAKQNPEVAYHMKMVELEESGVKTDYKSPYAK